MGGIVHWFDDLQYRRGLRRERVFRDRTNPLDIYNDIELYERFRLPRHRLLELIDELRPYLEHPTRRQNAISAEIQTLVGLRYLASGCFQNAVGDLVNINRSTACRIIRRVALALKGLLHRYVKFPSTDGQINIIKQGFHAIAGFPNVIACIDGTHIPIQAPTQNEWQFVNRKGTHSINIQLMCDHELKIVNCVVRWPGSTHDSRILTQSGIYRHLQQNPGIGYVLGDSGYPLMQWLMVPVINPADQAERRYNTAHMSTRSVIERCNGVLKRRFACLNKLRTSPERGCDIIQACIVLHNICMTTVGIQPGEDAVDDDLEDNGEIGQDDISGRMARRQLIQNTFN